MDYALYIASAIGAITLFMMAPRRGYNPLRLGGLLGAMALGGLWLALASRLPDLGPDKAPMGYYYIFSAIAIAAAARVITHKRPVYCALWFVMVILAAAGLLLLLDAAFVAFALIIIYAGAILVTYVFVIMLATHVRRVVTDDADDYDRVAREPLAATVIAFLLLAVLLSVAFQPMQPNPAAVGETDQALLTQQLTQRPADRLAQRLAAQQPDAAADLGQARVENVERVGMDLFRGHPLGLELAGVILLMSLVGAVVLARQRIVSHAADDDAAAASSIAPITDTARTS